MKALTQNEKDVIVFERFQLGEIYRQLKDCERRMDALRRDMRATESRQKILEFYAKRRQDSLLKASADGVTAVSLYGSN